MFWVPFVISHILLSSLILGSTYTGVPAHTIGIIYNENIVLGQSGWTMDQYWMQYITSGPVELLWLQYNRIAIPQDVHSLSSSGVDTIVSVLKCDQSRRVSVLTEFYRIPHLVLHVDTCLSHHNERYSLHLVNQYHYLPQLIADIAHQASSTKVGLIFDDTFENHFRSYFIKQLSGRGVSSVISKVEKMEVESIIVFIGNSSNLTYMMPETDSINKWLLVVPADWSDEDINALHCSCNSIIIQPQSDSLCRQNWNFRSSEVVKKILFERLLGAIKLAVDMKFQVHSSVGTDGYKEVGMADIPGYCVMTEYRIIRQTGNGHPLETVGSWKLGSGLNNLRTILLDTNKRILRIVTIGDFAPFSSKVPNQLGSYEGLVIDLLQEIATILNFRYVLLEPADGQFGSRTEDGNWTGAVGMVSRKEVDLGVAIFTLTTERSNAVDFSYPFMQNTLGILTANTDFQPHLLQIYKPFSPTVWCCIFCFGLMTTVVLLLTSRLIDSQNSSCIYGRNNGDIVLSVLATFCEQGNPSYPCSISGRCLFTSWFIFTLMVVSFYTARLTAVLTVSTPVKPIDSLEDLVKREDLLVISDDGTSIWDLFQNNNESDYQAIYSRMVDVVDMESTVKQVENGAACYLSDYVYLQYLVQLSCGKLRVSDGHFNYELFSFILPNHSPLKRGVDYGIQKVVESGVLEMTKRKWLNALPNCTNKNREFKKYNLDLDHLGGVFVLYLCFVCLSVIAFFGSQLICKTCRGMETDKIG